MPGIDLDRIEPDYLKDVRPRWNLVKTKHAAALKAKKISFNKGLGKLLDKRPPLYLAIRNWKAGSSVAAVKSKYAQIKSNAKAIETIVKAYKKQIVGLGNPAEQDLRTALDDLLSDVVKVDNDYTKLLKK